MKFGLFARPHLKSSPPGEEITFGRFWFCGRPFGKSSRWFFQRRGEHVSLSANNAASAGALLRTLWSARRMIFVIAQGRTNGQAGWDQESRSSRTPAGWSGWQSRAVIRRQLYVRRFCQS